MSEFVNQGGYAWYVWGAYGVCLVLLVAEVLVLRKERRTILARLGRLLRLRASGGNK